MMQFETKTCLEEKKDVEKIKVTKTEAAFLLKRATNELAALFRKTLMVDIPVMAIYPVMIYKNTTMYESFTIVHKLRFIPLPIDPSHYLFPEECECTETLRKRKEYEGEIINGCDKCSVEISLYAVGKEEGVREITSRNLWCPRYENLFDTIPEIPLLRIKKGEEIRLGCRAFKGTGEKNASFSPVTVVCFEKIEDSSQEENFSSCDEATGYREEDTFRFYMEAVGNIPAASILEKAEEIYRIKKEELSVLKRESRARYLPTGEEWKDLFC